MIDEDRTIQLYNYTSDQLKPHSHKPIVKVCDDCGTYSIVRKQAYHDLCKSCAQKNINNNKRKMRKYPKGKLSPMFGKYHTQEQKDKWSKDRKGKKLTEETKKKIGKSNKGKNKGCKHSFEQRIIQSCKVQGISRSEFKEFLTKQRYCKLFNNEFKEKIRNQYHNKCFLCDKAKVEEGKNLAVHHVNYNKNCLCGSNCEFVPLCASCHSQTNGFRQYWENLIMCYLYPEKYFMIDI